MCIRDRHNTFCYRLWSFPKICIYLGTLALMFFKSLKLNICIYFFLSSQTIFFLNAPVHSMGCPRLCNQSIGIATALADDRPNFFFFFNWYFTTLVNFFNFLFNNTADIISINYVSSWAVPNTIHLWHYHLLKIFRGPLPRSSKLLISTYTKFVEEDHRCLTSCLSFAPTMARRCV